MFRFRGFTRPSKLFSGRRTFRGLDNHVWDLATKKNVVVSREIHGALNEIYAEVRDMAYLSFIKGIDYDPTPHHVPIDSQQLRTEKQ